LFVLIEAVIEAVDNWYSEVQTYNFNQPQFSFGNGHFTQLVWKSSTQLGIGIAIAERGPGRCIYIVANYSPPGNVANQFSENVLPA
jgi:hypothetical protein